MKKLPREYRNMSKKELKSQLLHQMQCNIQIVKDNRSLVQTNMVLNKMIEKYKDLLSHSVENL
jgi:capsular polysaccharide biosynthesis protein